MPWWFSSNQYVITGDWLWPQVAPILLPFSLSFSDSHSPVFIFLCFSSCQISSSFVFQWGSLLKMCPFIYIMDPPDSMFTFGNFLKQTSSVSSEPFKQPFLFWQNSSKDTSLLRGISQRQMIPFVEWRALAICSHPANISWLESHSLLCFHFLHLTLAQCPWAAHSSRYKFHPALPLKDSCSTESLLISQ